MRVVRRQQFANSSTADRVNRAAILLALAGYSVTVIYLARRWDLPPIGPRAGLLLIMAVVVELIAKTLFGVQFRDALRQQQHRVTLRAAVHAALIGTMVARLAPAGGALSPSAMAWGIRTEDHHAAGAALRVTLTGFGGLLVMTGTTIGAAIAIGRTPFPGGGAPILAVALVVIGSAVLFGSRWLDRLVSFLPKALRRHYAPTVGRTPLSYLQFGLIVSRIALEAGVLWIVLRTFEVEVDFGQAMLVYGTAKVVAGLPATPGGLGLVEGGMIGLLVGMGFTPEIVVAPVLAYQLIDYWLLALIGLIAASRIPGPRPTPFEGSRRAAEAQGRQRRPSEGLRHCQDRTMRLCNGADGNAPERQSGETNSLPCSDR